MVPPKLEKKIQDTLMISSELSKQYWLEYKKYLLMCEVGAQPVSPSGQVDHVWHIHQTFTKQYRRDCLQFFGRVLQHRPASGGNEDSLTMKDSWEYTVSLYKALFDSEMP